MPYREHPWFIPPHQETKIWRYINLAKFMSMLGNDALWFSRADKIIEIDPYEGAYTYLEEYLLTTPWENLSPEWMEEFETKEAYDSYQDSLKFKLVAHAPHPSGLSLLLLVNTYGSSALAVFLSFKSQIYA